MRDPTVCICPQHCLIVVCSFSILFKYHLIYYLFFLFAFYPFMLLLSFYPYLPPRKGLIALQAGCQNLQ